MRDLLVVMLGLVGLNAALIAVYTGSFTAGAVAVVSLGGFWRWSGWPDEAK